MNDREAPATQIRVVIADDHEMVRRGLVMFLEAAADVTVVGRAKGLVDAIRDAKAGRSTLAAEAMQALVDRTVHGAAAKPPGTDLSAREREVLALLVRGLTNPEIARELVVSRSTINFHVRSILAKLGVQGRTQAVAVALQNHLVP